MKTRTLSQDAKLNERPAIQFCHFVESIIKASKVPTQQQCFFQQCFFPDELSNVRASYKLLTNAYGGLRKRISDQESTRNELQMPENYSHILGKYNDDIQALKLEMEKLQSDKEKKKSELEAQGRLIKEKIEHIHEIKQVEEENKRKQRSEQFMQAQMEKNRLQTERKNISDSMADKNFLQKMKMRKARHELKDVKLKIKKSEQNIEKMKSTLIVNEENPELDKLQSDWRNNQEVLQRYLEVCSDKMRLYNQKMQNAKDERDSVNEQFEKLKLEYNATVSKEVMDDLQLINDHLLRFFDAIEKCVVTKKTDPVLANRISILMKIAEDNRAVSHQMLSVLKCPDYPKQDNFQRKSSDPVISLNESPSIINQSPTFFSLIANRSLADEKVSSTSSLTRRGQ